MDKVEFFNNFVVQCKDKTLVSKTLSCGTNVAVVNLVYHVALYVNPECYGMDINYDHRYCFFDLNTAILSIATFETEGRWRFYRKDHDKNLTVAGCHLYPSGVLFSPEFAIQQVDWCLDEHGKLIIDSGK